MTRAMVLAIGVAVTLLAVAAVPGAWAQPAAKPAAAAETGYDEITLGLGWQNVDVDGNKRRFEQYVTQPMGVYPPLLAWERWGHRDELGWDLNLFTLGESGAAGDLWLGWSDTVAADAQYRKSNYYLDFAPNSGRSRRRDYVARVGSGAAARDWYWEGGVSGVNLQGSPAAGMVDSDQTTVFGEAGLRSGGYLFSVTGDVRDFDDRTGRHFSGDTQTLGGSIVSASTQTTHLAASFHRSATDLDDWMGRDVITWEATISATRPVNDDLDITAIARRHRVDETITQNAYAQANDSLRLESNYQLNERTTLLGYWDTREIEYVDGRHQGVVDVSTDLLGAQLRSRLTRRLRVKARYDRMDTDGGPLYYRVDGSRGNTVVWSTLEREEASLVYTHPHQPWGVTAEAQRRIWSNEAQGTSNRLTATSLTGWWAPLQGRLTTTASYTRHNYEFPIIDLATGGGYASRADSLVLGANFQVSDANSVYANYTWADSDGASSTDFDSWTLGWAREAGARNRLLAEVTLGDFTDGFDGSLDYDDQLVRVEWLRDL